MQRGLSAIAEHLVGRIYAQTPAVENLGVWSACRVRCYKDSVLYIVTYVVTSFGSLVVNRIIAPNRAHINALLRVACHPLSL